MILADSSFHTASIGLDQRETGHRLLGLREGAVGHRDHIAGGRHPHPTRFEAAGGRQDARSGQFLNEFGHLGVQLLVRGGGGLGQHQVAHQPLLPYVLFHLDVEQGDVTGNSGIPCRITRSTSGREQSSGSKDYST